MPLCLHRREGQWLSLSLLLSRDPGCAPRTISSHMNQERLLTSPYTSDEGDPAFERIVTSFKSPLPALLEYGLHAKEMVFSHSHDSLLQY